MNPFLPHTKGSYTRFQDVASFHATPHPTAIYHPSSLLSHTGDMANVRDSMTIIIITSPVLIKIFKINIHLFVFASLNSPPMMKLIRPIHFPLLMKKRKPFQISCASPWKLRPHFLGNSLPHRNTYMRNTPDACLHPHLPPFITLWNQGARWSINHPTPTILIQSYH